MERSTMRNLRPADRRHWHRVRLAAPVQFGRVGAKRQAPFLYTGHTADLSTAGAYVVTSQRCRFALGEILKVSLAIPAESRECFPFARMTGLCRVVRAELLSTADQGKRRGLALACCPDAMTLLGATTEERLDNSTTSNQQDR